MSRGTWNIHRRCSSGPTLYLLQRGNERISCCNKWILKAPQWKRRLLDGLTAKSKVAATSSQLTWNKLLMRNADSRELTLPLDAVCRDTITRLAVEDTKREKKKVGGCSPRVKTRTRAENPADKVTLVTIFWAVFKCVCVCQRTEKLQSSNDESWQL